MSDNGSCQRASSWPIDEREHEQPSLEEKKDITTYGNSH